MTNLWKVADFVSEVQHLDKLLQAQPNGQLGQSMTTSLCTKLQASKNWTSSAILTLIQALEQSTLPQNNKETIQGAINSLEGQNQGHLKTVLQGQMIVSFCQYISKLDWEKLEASPSNTTDTMSILAKRLKCMGVVSRKENTKKQAMAVILYLLVHKGGKPMPMPVDQAFHDVRICCHLFSYSSRQSTKLSKVPRRPQGTVDQSGANWLTQQMNQL